MLSVNEYLENQELGKLYPWMEATEKRLKEQGIDPDTYMLEKLSEPQLLNEVDPLSLGLGAMGAYAAHKGYKALGGWDGIKSLAKTGWEGAKRTWGDMRAQHAANKLGQDRDALAGLAAKTGARVSMPTATRADTTTINRLAHDAGNILNGINSTSDVVKNHPQVQALVGQIQQALDALKALGPQLSSAPQGASRWRNYSEPIPPPVQVTPPAPTPTPAPATP